MLNARLRECARTRYARVRVRIGASIYARCDIANEKVHGSREEEYGKERRRRR